MKIKPNENSNKEIKINDSYLVHKQVLASIGQPMLMKAYENFFSKKTDHRSAMF